MDNMSYEEKFDLIFDAIECKNKKPLVSLSGPAVGPDIMGMSMEEFCEKPIEGALASIAMVKKLQDEAGVVHAQNSIAAPVPMPIPITMLWNSKVLIPGKDIPANSVWQVKEQKLIEPDAYDDIMSMGYQNFLNEKIYPRIIDKDYVAKYTQIAQERGHEVEEAYVALGVPRLNSPAIPANIVPFEQLCGMRSMTHFYMDCYKMPDKLKEVSDFIFQEKRNNVEEQYKTMPDDKNLIGIWVGGWRTASAMLNPKIWELLVWPYMKDAAMQVIDHGKIAIMHLDQDWNRDIERFGELPAGKTILNLDGMTDMANARKLLPKHTLMGDVPATLFTTGTPQQVYDYVTKLIDDCGPEGLIICPGCDAPVGTKFENLVAMVKATNEWH